MARVLNVRRQFNVNQQNKSKNIPESIDNSSNHDKSQPWRGFRVVFTGLIEGLHRSDAQSIAKELGAKSTPGSVSKSTNLVVYADEGGAKLKKARLYGISTMSAEEFLSMARKTGLTENSK